MLGQKKKGKDRERSRILFWGGKRMPTRKKVQGADQGMNNLKGPKKAKSRWTEVRGQTI